jgi:curved DNA-binding protein CbpA
MAGFEDYYEILGVNAEASPQEIERAWKDLRIILHPDRVPEASPSAKKRAEKEFKKASQAYDVLKDPHTRRDFHKEWLRKKGSATSSAKDRAPTKPKPIIDPRGIVFKNMRPGETKRTSFLVINVGGPYSKIHISNPDSWLKISDWHSISTNDELPLKVNITAQADDSSKKRSENVYIQLDDIQTYITVILEPKMRMEIRDHNWHDVEFENLNSWAQRQFISGKSEFKGTHFEYRLEPKIYRKIRDHNWHDVGFADLNPWAQGQFNSGKAEFKGKYFEYKKNQINGKYQFRLQHKHKSAIYATVIPGRYQFRLLHKHKSAIYAP